MPFYNNNHCIEVLLMKTAGQLCRELGIRYYRLDYLIRSGYVPEPKRLDSGQRVFTNEDIKRIEEKLFEMKAR